jgi:hypothetical protein
MSKTNSAISGAATGASVGGPWGAVAGGIGGYLLGKDDESGNILAEQLKAAQGIPLPVLEKMNPELYKVVASLNPEMQQQVLLGPSATDGISLDPKYKQAQMSALNKLMNITENNGQDAQSMADNARLQNQVNTNLKGNTAAIEQNMAARGMSGSGNEMVARQMAAQDAANRQAQMGMDINAQAQQRALSALMNQSNVGNQMSQTDFNQQNTKAQSQDAISKFNAQNSQQVNDANTNARNNAQQINAQNKQYVANKNVDVNNTAQQYNIGRNQQNFQNQMAKTGLTNNISNNQATNSYNQSRDQDEFLGGLFGSVAKYQANKGSK